MSSGCLPTRAPAAGRTPCGTPSPRAPRPRAAAPVRPGPSAAPRPPAARRCVSSSARAVARAYDVGDADAPRDDLCLDLVGHRVGHVDGCGDDARAVQAGQNRLPGLPKCVCVAAVRSPGLMPANSSRMPGAEQVGHLGVAVATRSSARVKETTGPACHPTRRWSSGCLPIAVVGVGGRAYRRGMDGGVVVGILIVIALSLTSVGDAAAAAQLAVHRRLDRRRRHPRLRSGCGAGSSRPSGARSRRSPAASAGWAGSTTAATRAGRG